MKLNKTTLACVFSAAMLLGSCKKDALDIESPAILLADNLYTNKAGFDAGLNGLYAQVRRSRSGNTLGAINQMMLEPAYIGVDNAYGNYRDSFEDIFNNWGANNNAAVAHYRLEWAWLYETINAANTIIHRAENPAVTWTADQKNQALAEARFIRAWCYRHLTYMWGDVPLTLEESSGENIREDWPRNTVAEVRAAMEADLLFAEANLPVTSTVQGKVLKGAAQHYLAELYLAMGKNDLARDMALKVTTNTNYKLITARYGVNAAKPGTPFTDMFIEGNVNRNQGNTEALWTLQEEINVIGGEGDNLMRRYWVNRYYSFTFRGTDNVAKSPFIVSADYGGRGIGRMGPTRYALDIYGAGDDRGSDFAWRFSYAINNPAGIPKGKALGDVLPLDRTSVEKITNPNWPSTRKWDYTSPIDVNVDRQYNDQIYVRSADTYLLLAEAYFKLGDLTNAAATINVLRARAHASNITPAQVNIDFILDERSRELFSEEERRYTLLRTGKWLERTKLYNNVAKLTVTERDQLFPIPQDVLNTNRKVPMRQNPGY
jgi:hypothetical protein